MIWCKERVKAVYAPTKIDIRAQIVGKAIQRLFYATGRLFFLASAKKSIFAASITKRKKQMNRLLLGTMLWAVICLAAGCTEDDETTQGQWIKKVSYNGYARSYACSFTIGNKGYLCTGYRGANKEFLNDLWEFDMDSETWTQCETMPV